MERHILTLLFFQCARACASLPYHDACSLNGDLFRKLQEEYRDDHEVYLQFMELLVNSVDAASRRGAPLLSGDLLHPIPLGNKGDWPYLVP